MQPKKLHQNSITGAQGINLIQKIVLAMGFAWHPTGDLDTGIDGIIEIRNSETGETTNSIIQVQSKATKVPFQKETDTSFDYTCDPRDVDYWLKGNAPVILIVSRPVSEEAYWISVKDYFSDPEKKKTNRIHFNKRMNRFEPDCKTNLITLAIPRDAGIYFTPVPQEETLYSNLLKVSAVPKQLFIATTEYRGRRALWAELNKLGGEAGGEWILKAKQILTVHDLEMFPWNKICDAGTIESFDSDEWENSDDPDKRRDFVQLLNRCFRELTWKLGLRYNEARECYFFQATRNLSPRKLWYQSISKKTSRMVFQGYASKRDLQKILYYRHSSFKAQFVRYDGIWYVEITPTYHFTSDGHHLDKFYGDKLKRIKEEERNPAVLGQVIMWAEYLSKKADLLGSPYRFLELGELMTFKIDVGITDEQWLPHEEEEKRKALSISEPGLFD